MVPLPGDDPDPGWEGSHLPQRDWPCVELHSGRTSRLQNALYIVAEIPMNGTYSAGFTPFLLQGLSAPV